MTFKEARAAARELYKIKDERVMACISRLDDGEYYVEKEPTNKSLYYVAKDGKVEVLHNEERRKKDHKKRKKERGKK